MHDTLEDTATTCADLLRGFGDEVAELVVELTNIYTPEAFPTLNRKERKALERARLAKVSSRAKLTKRADVAHNITNIERFDPEFAAVWLPENAALLKVL